MAKYYDISLKNTRRYEARDVRLNGMPLIALQTISGPGRLDFVAIPQESGGVIGGFKSMSGMDSEVEIVDPAAPGRRRKLHGRVTSAILHPATAHDTHEYEQVTFIFNKID